MGVRSYVETLRALLPQGRAWNREAGSRTDDVLTALSDELDRVDMRAGDLMAEIDPRTTDELLNEWERELGLPGDCGGVTAGSTDEDRRAAIIAQLVATGRQDEAYFLELLAGFGFTGTVTNSEPFEMGVHGMGDPIGGSEWRHVWTLTTDQWPGEDLQKSIECTINRYKPAQTVVLFQYNIETVEFESEDALLSTGGGAGTESIIEVTD